MTSLSDLVESDSSVIRGVFPVFIHDLLRGEGAERVAGGAAVALLAVPRCLVVRAIHAAVARAGASAGQVEYDKGRNALKWEEK